VLRDVIRDTVPDAAEVDTELRHLQAILQEGLTTISLPATPSPEISHVRLGQSDKSGK